MGIIYFKLDADNISVEVYDISLGYNPNCIKTLFNLDVTKRNLKNYQEAIGNIEKHYNVEPNNREVSIYLKNKKKSKINRVHKNLKFCGKYVI